MQYTANMPGGILFCQCPDTRAMVIPTVKINKKDIHCPCAQGIFGLAQLKPQRLFPGRFQCSSYTPSIQGIDPRFLPNVNAGRADGFTPAAINAMGRLAINSSQAKKSDEPSNAPYGHRHHQTPEIPNSDRQAGQHKNYNESRYGHIRKKFEHFDIGKLIIRAMNKML